MTRVTGTATVLQANARTLPLADDSVDLVVTSPPYFALRSYQDAGEHYDGQIGDEPTPSEFVDSLLEVTAECVRVLKPSGSLWVNLGDKYSTYESRPGKAATHDWAEKSQQADRYTRSAPDAYGVRYKSLMGIPWRYALRCIDDLGLILRAEVVWSKPNGLPESVTDRVRRSHEQWFHFTIEPRYYSAVDEIREAHTWTREIDPKWAEAREATAEKRGGGHRNGKAGGFTNPQNPLGKLPGSVWTVPTEPLKVPDSLGVDHFAAFPTEWPRRIIQGWSPAAICTACGEGRRPVGETVVDETRTPARQNAYVPDVTAQGNGNNGSGSPTWGQWTKRLITGYVCACPDTNAATRPAIVLDPFGGTGTTAMVAKALGRHGITIDMSADYCRLANWRTNDRDQLAKVLGIDKAPTKPDPHQLDLFGEAL